MKRITLSILTAAIFSAAAFFFAFRKLAPDAPQYSSNVRHVVEQIRATRDANVPSVGSSSRPLGAGPHRFFILSQYVAAVASFVDLEQMLHDPSPNVRVAGAITILGSNRWKMEKSKVDFLLTDRSKVLIVDDCIPAQTTVGNIVAALKHNPWMFDKTKPGPNKAPEPTPVSVMPRATEADPK